jgi:hypothetical protein
MLQNTTSLKGLKVPRPSPLSTGSCIPNVLHLGNSVTGKTQYSRDGKLEMSSTTLG